MEIIKLNGTDNRLYSLVARLVMSPAILRQNNNYPFKTTLHHTWYVALDNGTVAGFLPVKRTSAGLCIDNYYVRSDSAETLGELVREVVDDTQGPLLAVVHKRHVKSFAERGFVTRTGWTKYEKMQYVRSKSASE